MSDSTYHILGILHGSLGGSLLALLALSVWVRRRGEIESFGSGLTFSAMLQVLQVSLGLVLHVQYEGRLRRILFLRAPALAWWFERKEHLAVGAVALTWCALASHWASRVAAGRSVGYARCASLAAFSALVLSFVVFTVGAVTAAGMMEVAR